MYDKKIVIEQLISKIGFRQPLNTDIVVDADLVADKPVKADRIHHLLTLENIHAAAPNYKTAKTLPFEAGVPYNPGTLIKHTDGNWYEAQVETTGVVPGTDEDIWKSTNPFSVFVRDGLRDSAENAISEIWNRIKSEASTPAPPVETRLFSGGGNESDKILNLNQCVGLRIQAKNLADVLVTIKRVGLHFTMSQTGLTLYLYHSNRPNQPLSVTVTSTSPYDLTWVNTGEKFKMQDYDPEGFDIGGFYYLFYKQSEVNGMALRKVRDLASASCGTCNAYDPAAYNKYNKYVKIQAFSVDEEDFVDGKLWDTGTEDLHTDTTWGLNLHVAFKCDLTRWLSENDHIIGEIINLSVARHFLGAMCYNMRNNDLSNEEKNLALFALRGGKGDTGINTLFEEAVAAFRFDTKSVNSICFPRAINNIISVTRA